MKKIIVFAMLFSFLGLNSATGQDSLDFKAYTQYKGWTDNILKVYYDDTVIIISKTDTFKLTLDEIKYAKCTIEDKKNKKHIVLPNGDLFHSHYDKKIKFRKRNFKMDFVIDSGFTPEKYSKIYKKNKYFRKFLEDSIKRLNKRRSSDFVVYYQGKKKKTWTPFDALNQDAADSIFMNNYLFYINGKHQNFDAWIICAVKPDENGEYYRVNAEDWKIHIPKLKKTFSFEYYSPIPKDNSYYYGNWADVVDDSFSWNPSFDSMKDYEEYKGTFIKFLDVNKIKRWAVSSGLCSWSDEFYDRFATDDPIIDLNTETETYSFNWNDFFNQEEFK